MSWLINLLYLCLLAILSPWLLYKAATTGKYRRGMRQKFRGNTSHPLLSKQWPGPTVWLHGVSVGEIHLLRGVVAACKIQHPDWRLVISTTTDTGYDEACKIFGDLPVVWWPLDFSWAVKRALDIIGPDLVVLGESELWPNFLRAAESRGVPVAVINARMSPLSAARFERFSALTSGLFRRVRLFAAQTEEYADRYRRLGAPRVVVTGSVKYDGAVSERGNPRTLAMAQLFALGERGGLAPRGTGSLAATQAPLREPSPRGGDARSPADESLVWVAGSTQAPEEEICLAVFRKVRERHPRLRLILVPRQKDRFEEVARLLEKSGLPFVRRSQLREPTTAPIILVDTIGELSAIWGLADVAFVGGSLDGQRGGQNMIEPAAYGAAALFGPHTWNFKETVARLLEHRAAIQAANVAQLETHVFALLADGSLRRALGDAAQAFVRSQQGATHRTLVALANLINESAVKHAA
jgi:3-deoxy-D-manno-octulosonic-acid transferase